MHQIFFNPEERRTRSFFRIVSFLFFCIFSAGVASIFKWPWATTLATAAFILFFYYFFILFIDKRPWSESGLVINRQWISELFFGIGVAFFVMALIFLVELWLGNLEFIGFGWERSSGENWIASVFSYFLIMVGVGLYEELLMRGYLIPNITEGFTFGKIKPEQALIFAIILSSSIFGFAHAANPNSSIFAVANIVLAGIMLAVPYVITGRLSISIGIHFAWNFVQGGIFGFPVSGMRGSQSVIRIKQYGPEWWSGGAFGPEGGVIGILGILVILSVMLFYLKRKQGTLRFAPFLEEKYSKRVTN